MPKWKGFRFDVAVSGLADARVAEEASDGMLLVERFERPAVGAGSGTCVRDGECCNRCQHTRRLKRRRTETANEVAMRPPSEAAKWPTHAVLTGR